MAKTQKPLSTKAQEALDFLKEHGNMTLSEMKEKGLEGINSSHLTALRNRGLVNSTPVEKEVVTVSKRTVQEYSVAEEKGDTEEPSESPE